MKETFTLKDIEVGMVVICDYDTYLVVPNEEMDGLLLVSERGFQPLVENYNEDLKMKRELLNGEDSVAAHLDIKQVYGRTNKLGRGMFYSVKERTLLFDRDRIVE